MVPATSSQKQKMHMWQTKLNKINLFFIYFKDWSKSKINLKIKIKIDPKCNYKKVYFILYLFFITRGSIPYAIEMECMKRVAAWESLPKIKEKKEYRVWRKTERDIAMTCDKIMYFYFLFLFLHPSPGFRTWQANHYQKQKIQDHLLFECVIVFIIISIYLFL